MATRPIIQGRLPAAPEKYDRDNEQLTRRIIELALAELSGGTGGVLTSIQRFREPGTHEWVKPERATVIEVYVVGGGGGGGSGAYRPDNTSNAGGGAGGQGGSLKIGKFLADQLPNTVQVVVGAGGAGGEERTAQLTGADGGNGDESRFGSFVVAAGGKGGGGGTFGSGIAATQSLKYDIDSRDHNYSIRGAFLAVGARGSARPAHLAGSVGPGGYQSDAGAGGGAGGNSLVSGNAAAGGEDGGGRVFYITPGISSDEYHRGKGPKGGGVDQETGEGKDGASGPEFSALFPGYGGGGGGGGKQGQVAGHGGDGGTPGGGGGGGGGARGSGARSGAGGKGGDGEVLVICFLNETPNPGDVAHFLNDHIDTDLGTPAVGDAPVWNGSKWVSAPVLTSLHTHDASAIVSGVLSPERLGSGGPDDTKFLRGDGVWASIGTLATDPGLLLSDTARANSTTIDVLGTSGVTTSGTGVNLSPTNDNPLTAATSQGRNSGTSANAVAGWRSNAHIVVRARPDLYIGGFKVRLLFGFGNVGSGRRGWFGLHHDLGASIGGANPSTLTQCVLFGFDTTDTVFQLMHNDGSGTCTKVSTGIPIEAGVLYEVGIENLEPESWRVILNAHKTTGKQSFVSTITSDLPTEFLFGYRMQYGNAATGANIQLRLVGAYISTFPASEMSRL